MLRLIIKIALLTIVVACTPKMGHDYYECLLLSAQDPSKASKGLNAEEICAQIHPARKATDSEAINVEIYVHGRFLGYKQLEIRNRNTNFMVTEVILRFKDSDRMIPIRFTTKAKPMAITWTEDENTGFQHDYELAVPTIIGRPYK